MLKKSFFGWCLILVLAIMTVAQDEVAVTPASNSVERMAIMNALRAPVEKELKQRVQFTIKHFKVTNTWAFIMGEPLNLKFAQLDYAGTPYQKAIDAGAFENNYQALLKKTAGKWKIVTYLIGCTDVCWLDWNEKHKSPTAIFPEQSK